MGKSWEYHGNIMGISWENHGKIMGISWESNGNIMGKSWEYHGKIMGKSWEYHGNKMGNNGVEKWDNKGIDWHLRFNKYCEWLRNPAPVRRWDTRAGFCPNPQYVTFVYR